MSISDAVWVNTLSGGVRDEVAAQWGKTAHLLDPSSPPVQLRSPGLAIGVPKRTVCGVIILTIYAVPHPGPAKRCKRCQRIATRVGIR